MCEGTRGLSKPLHSGYDRRRMTRRSIVLEDKDLEVIGMPIIKYGDSTVIMQHATTCLWVSYKVNI